MGGQKLPLVEALHPAQGKCAVMRASGRHDSERESDSRTTCLPNAAVRDSDMRTRAVFEVLGSVKEVV